MLFRSLAGCNTASNGGNNGEGEGEGQVSTSNSATILHDAMKGDARKMTTPVANTALDTALKNAVDTYFQNTEYAAVANEDNVVVNSKIADALVEAMNAKKNIVPDLEKSANNDKVTVAVKLFSTEASVSDTYALEKVAEFIENSVADLDEVSENGEWKYDFTISASIVTKPVTSVIANGITTGVKYIAVAVTQTPTKIA